MSQAVGFFQDAFQSIHDAVVIGNAKGEVKYMNPAASALTDHSPDDLRAVALDGLFPEVVEQIQRDASGCCGRTALILENDSAVEIELTWNTLELSGERHVKLVFQKTNGDILSSFGSELRHLFNSVFDHIPDQVFIKDRHHRMVVCNRATALSLGKDAPYKTTGKCDHDFFSKEDADIFRTIENRVLNEGHQTENVEEAYVNAQNKKCVLLSTKVPLKNLQGEIIGLAGINRDITERKRMENELCEAREEAERTALTKSTFLTNMSHEIRTPLNAIIGMSSLLADTSMGDEQREFVEIINTSSDALLDIVNTILDLSKIEAGKFDLESSPFSLVQAVEKTVDIVAAKAAEKGIELMQSFTGEMPEIVIGDALRLRQILLNLLSNAIKFTTEGEILVEVEGKPLGAQDYQIRFLVSDTGIGMTAEDTQRIFQPFEQADSSITRKYGGTGLGLSICKKLVEMMGGKMTVRSKKDVGSEFRFCIVVRRANDDSFPEVAFDPAVLEGRRILVVDDNTTNLKRELEKFHMEPLTFCSGVTALEQLDTLGPLDMAILDYTMPEMDGCTLAKKLRLRPEFENRPILILSSSRRPRSKAGSVINRWMKKPVKERHLQEALAELLEGYIERDPEQRDKTEKVSRELARKFPYKILLVEDNKVNQMVTQKMLSKMGYEADLAKNGQEAVEAVLSHAYNLVLMDIQMPVMDGLEATRIIRNKLGDSDGPVILGISAHALTESRDEAMRAGMNDYLTKPIKTQDLIQALKQL